MDTLHLPTALDHSSHVLLAGAGGGFDVYAALPLYARLRALGRKVTLANLSFTYLGGTEAKQLTRALYAVDADTTGGDDYFPERTLARFLARRGDATTVYALDKMGVAPVREAYAHLVAAHGIDAIVLVDGGTDILMTGDEAGLGTPAEDVTSLAAVTAIDVPTRLVACVGFGIDAFHGVCHAHWLENVAALTSDGAFLGACALLPTMPEAQLYLDSVADSENATPTRPSIVNGSIASAIEGRFGDVHRSERTTTSELFINPLMSLVWMLDLMGVAKRNLYVKMLRETQTVWEVQRIIEAFRHGVRTRARRAIPH
jgi:hypothetical protein